MHSNEVSMASCWQSFLQNYHTSGRRDPAVADELAHAGLQFVITCRNMDGVENAPGRKAKTVLVAGFMIFARPRAAE
jgi:hypothetical protein